MRAQRRGLGDPLDHCALNVALYGAKANRWAMTERGRTALRRDATALRIGPSSMSWNGQSLTFEIDEVAVPIPNRIKGVVRVYPSNVNERVFALDGKAQHRWWPIAPRARVEVVFERPACRWNGFGYLDSNFGDVPLQNSFSHWNWSRAHIADETAILYDVKPRDGTPTSLALRIDARGAMRDMEMPPQRRLPNGLWGVARETRADAGAAIRILRKLEDAPFYTRSVIETEVSGTRVEAVHESLSLDRFSAPWVQALLPFRMPRRAKV